MMRFGWPEASSRVDWKTACGSRSEGGSAMDRFLLLVIVRCEFQPAFNDFRRCKKVSVFGRIRDNGGFFPGRPVGSSHPGPQVSGLFRQGSVELLGVGEERADAEGDAHS